MAASSGILSIHFVLLLLVVSLGLTAVDGLNIGVQATDHPDVTLVITFYSVFMYIFLKFNFVYRFKTEQRMQQEMRVRLLRRAAVAKIWKVLWVAVQWMPRRNSMRWT
ncbi:hypothetical protein LINGRAHAP2_LOCUS21342 [Linum grandiflorum]